MHVLRYCRAILVSLVTLPAVAQAPADTHGSAGAHQRSTKQSPYRNIGHSGWAAQFNAATWGVDQLRVQKTSSGTLIRFSYRVVDVKKAQILHDKRAEPHLVGLRSHAMLSVPTLDNVGQLRQTEALENGKDYWVLFSNKGDLVKIGDRVDVVIGDFYASGLTVE
jgi:hypothetical protein